MTLINKKGNSIVLSQLYIKRKLCKEYSEKFPSF